MKPYLLILLLFLGCVEKTPAQIKAKQESEKIKYEETFNDMVKTIEYEGHEYLWVISEMKSGICHKANCKHCEKNKQ